MEILRFDEAGSSTPRRKKSSRGMIIAGLIATLFGVGSAFASTSITINSNTPVQVGSGVSLVAACDPNITVQPHTRVDTGTATGPTFDTDYISLSNIDTSTTNTTSGLGCASQYFDLQVFHGDTSTATAYNCAGLGASSTFTVTSTGTTTSPASITGTCSDSLTPGQITFQMPVTATGNPPTFKIPFGTPQALTTLSYITLSSRSS
jgi:hypothetical protein